MLLATQVMDAPSANYIEPQHPLQEVIRTTLADFTGVEAAAIPTGPVARHPSAAAC